MTIGGDGGEGGTRVEDVLCDEAPFDDIVLRILVFFIYLDILISSKLK